MNTPIFTGANRENRETDRLNAEHQTVRCPRFCGLLLPVLSVICCSNPLSAAVSNITFIAEANISIHATNNVAGNSVDVGISGSAGGETNYLGEVSNTNATKMGLAYGKAGVTNQLRSVEAGNGLISTNQGTNIIFAVNTLLANLIGAAGNVVSNANANQFSIASGLLNWITGGWQTNLNAQGPGTNNGNFYAISFNGTGAGNAVLALQGTDGNISSIAASPHIATNNTLLLPTNALTGVLLAENANNGTNQARAVALANAQYITYNGTAYVASNLPASSGGGISTNGNQFGASVTVTIKSGALATNFTFYPDGASTASIAAHVTGNNSTITNDFEWRLYNEVVYAAMGQYGLSIGTNHQAATGGATLLIRPITSIGLQLDSYPGSGNALVVPGTNSGGMNIGPNGGIGSGTQTAQGAGNILATNIITAQGQFIGNGAGITNLLSSPEQFLFGGNRTIATSAGYWLLTGVQTGGTEAVLRTPVPRGGTLSNLFLFIGNSGGNPQVTGTNTGFFILTNGVSTGFGVVLNSDGATLMASNTTGSTFVPAGVAISGATTNNVGGAGTIVQVNGRLYLY